MSRDQWPRGRRLRPDHDVDLTIPVIDLLEVRPAAEGAVEVPLTDGVRNPWGILHGGVVAVAAEEAVLRHPAATGRPPLGMLVRYLAPNRVGPIRFVAELIGADAAGAVFRVRSHDTGAADRATSVTVLTLGPELS
jgi:acyl-coenzyme A thioesterase PaaI-like protein